MNILIVEDDMFKYLQIESLVKKVRKDAIITKFDNIHDTIIFLKDNVPDKIILDMSLPSHEAKVGEGSPVSMPTGGIEIILELRSKNILTTPIIILTQYPEIEIENEFFSIEESEEQIQSNYNMENLTVIQYQNELPYWNTETTHFLRQ